MSRTLHTLIWLASAAACFSRAEAPPKGLPEPLRRFAREVNVPILPKTVRETGALGTDTKALDDTFDALIVGYSQATRMLLREIYYGGLHLEDKPGLIATSRTFGEAQLLREEGKTSFKVFIDPLIRKCPILLRVTLIHEVAVHVGQWNQRIEQVGIETYVAENRNLDFSLFSELTAHVVEKRALDRIPLESLEKEIQIAFSDPKLRDDLLTEMRFRRKAKFELYPWLRLRVAYSQQKGFQKLSEYQIRDFVQIYEAKEGLKENNQ